MPFTTPEDGMTGLANGFLASLSQADRDCLEPHLLRLRFQSGDTLTHSPDEARLVYFPVTLVACVQFADQGSGIGMVGREGIVGLSAMLGGTVDDAMEATVLMEGGWTLAITVEDLQQACLASPTLSLSLLGFLHSYSSQLGWMIRARDRGAYPRGGSVPAMQPRPDQPDGQGAAETQCGPILRAPAARLCLDRFLLIPAPALDRGS